jgi:ABC-2 type transport system permease protein
VLLLRLTMLDEWPWIEIVIALFILTASIWLSMKMAGKIFKTGILLYGKNATLKEIWKWIRA